MNQTASKRYKQVVKPEKGDFNVINILTKEVIVSDRTFDDCTTIALGYNHQYCQPNKDNIYFVQHKNNQLCKE